MNFVICGLPRSGTTIIARFIAGLDGVTVLHEPYQRAAKFGPFPPVIPSAAESSHHFGFKEPFWGIEAGCQLRNDAILRVYQKFGWRFLWVCRHPLDTYASSKDFLSMTLADFQTNWHRFHAFRASFPDPGPELHYEQFCADPLATWNRLLPLPLPATREVLAPVPDMPFVGDPAAATAQCIWQRDHRRWLNLTIAEHAALTQLMSPSDPSEKSDPSDPSDKPAHSSINPLIH